MSGEIEVNPLVDSLVAARSVPAVQKAELASLRSKFPDRVVFVFEGIDDKTVYREWVRRANPDLVFEPFLCGNKNFVLQLMDIVERDRSGVGHDIYFFVDKDFDGLRGRTRTSSVFVTEAYSIENYLVGGAVLEELLVVNFHCHAQPEIRERILEKFDRVYDKFLNETRDLNWRIFLQRKCEIHRVEKLPSRIGQIATVSLDDSTKTPIAVDKLVILQRDPVDDELDRWRPEFDELEPRKHYRGKFALLFFKRWLELLVVERNAAPSTWFGELANDGLTPHGYFGVEVLASRSRLPEGLADFLGNINTPGRAH